MVNKSILIGNLGADPELRYTTNGTAVATLSIATTRKWKDRDGNKQEETEWHRCQVWAQTAEYAGNYLHKGSKVYIEGRLQTKKWKDQDGKDMYTTEIVVSDLQNLTPRQDGGSAPPQEPYGGIVGDTGDYVPF